MFSALTVVPDRRNVNMMKVLEDTFGKKVTTRNWNTALRVLKTAL